MAAKAIVPFEAFPCISRFRGHGRLSGRWPAAACRAEYEQGGCPLYIPPWMRDRQRDSTAPL
jgi:hypothetical protein